MSEQQESKVVLVVSPYTATSRKELERNRAYARAAMRDALARGETPIASHVLYGFSGVLDNAAPEERARGIVAGVELGALASGVVAYVDHGTTDGMRTQVELLRAAGRPVELRMLEGWRWPEGSGPAATDTTQG